MKIELTSTRIRWRKSVWRHFAVDIEWRGEQRKWWKSADRWRGCLRLHLDDGVGRTEAKCECEVWTGGWRERSCWSRQFLCQIPIVLLKSGNDAMDYIYIYPLRGDLQRQYFGSSLKAGAGYDWLPDCTNCCCCLTRNWWTWGGSSGGDCCS